MGTGAFFALSDEEEVEDWAEDGRLCWLLPRREALEGEEEREEVVEVEREVAFWPPLSVPSFFFFELFFEDAPLEGILASLAG